MMVHAQCVLIFKFSFKSCRMPPALSQAVTSGLIFSGLSGVVPGYDAITDPNNPKPNQMAALVRAVN
jgi:hypothetical protein